MSLSDFAVLETLHVPLQFIADKRNTTSRLHDSLPRSLRELWLNDDGALLWLNHQDFIHPIAEHWMLDTFWFEGNYHPVHTDEEIIALIAEYLAKSHLYTPYLESLNLLFYFFLSRTWGQRNVDLIRDSLGTTVCDVVLGRLRLLKAQVL
jgi:hypothetical protein